MAEVITNLAADNAAKFGSGNSGLAWSKRYQYAEAILRESIFGSPRCAYANTISSYAMRTWLHGDKLLKYFPPSITSEGAGPTRVLDEPWQQLGAHFDWYPDGTRFFARLRDGKSELPEYQLDNLIKLVQQMCWMSLVLSASRTGTEPATAGIALSSLFPPKPSTPMAILDLTVKYTRMAEEQKKSLCWLSLFAEPVLALGFPVPPRSNEVGLEMPLRLMATICGACHFVNFQGGVLIKGLTSMLIPTARYGGGNIVQWHLISKDYVSDGDQRLSYMEGVKACARRLTFEDLDFASLSETRAVLGWCKGTKTVFGDPDYTFEDITYTGLGNDIRSTIQLSEVNLGFQQFVSAGMKLSLSSKPRKLVWKRDDDYRANVVYASRTPVLLFNPSDEDRRGWLVMASDILLLVARHRIFTGDAVCQTLNFDGKTSKDVLLNLLYQGTTAKREQFMSMACGIWSLLEYFRDDLISRNQAHGAAEIELRIRKRTLPGLEYMDLMQNEGSASIKQTQVRSTNGGWLQLVRDIDCLVLFGTGFGDVISPSEKSQAQLCGNWASGLPKGTDYMATSVPTLLHLYEKAGCKQTHVYLSSNSKLQWDQGKSCLFEDCPDTSQNCECSRLQQIIRGNGTHGSISPLNVHGALIFGTKSTHSFRKAKETLSGFYTHNNAKFSRYAESDDDDHSDTEQREQSLDTSGLSSSNENHQERKKLVSTGIDSD